jgi:hypothetical protein
VKQRARASVAVGGAVLAAACYTYAPATLDAVPIGTHVQAVLSSDAEVAWRDSLGVTLRPLRGTVVARDAAHVLLAVRTGSGSAAFGSHALYQQIAVLPEDVLRVDVRRLHPARTGLFMATAALAATLVTLGVLGKLNPGSPNGGGGPPE